ncbi:MAG: DUF459 domain-containing protein [Actinomycetota bacterium]
MFTIGKRLRSLGLVLTIGAVAVISSSFVPFPGQVGAGPTEPTTTSTTIAPPTTTTVPSKVVHADTRGRFTVLEIGDSLGIDLGWGFGVEVTPPKSPKVTVIQAAKGSTGLSNDWYYPWPANFSTLLHRYSPQVAVILLGTNDEQAIRVGATICSFNSTCWRTAYGGRVRQMLNLARLTHTQVIWVAALPMGAPAFNQAMIAINSVTRPIVTASSNGTFYETKPLFTSVHGAYRSTAIVNRQLQAIREPDGIHINLLGSDCLALGIIKSLKTTFGVPITPALPLLVQ